MPTLPTKLHRILEFLLLCALAGFLFWAYSYWSYDDPYITFRYAQNLLAGNGFVYNPGERILSTTAPLYALLLAVIGFAFSDLPKIAALLGCISLALSGWLLLQLARQLKMPLAGWIGFVFLPLFPLAGTTLSSETPIYLAVSLAAVLAYIRKEYILTALLGTLLGFLRPDGVLLPAVLALYHVTLSRGKIPWRAAALYAGLNLLWWGGLWLYFGSPIPVTLYAKHQQGLMVISQKFAPGLIATARGYLGYWYYLVMAALAGIGLLYLVVKRSRGLLLVAWTLAYTLAYTLLGVTSYFWYFVPLLPGFFFLTGAGGQALLDKGALLVKNRRWRTLGFAAGAAALVVLAGFEGSQTYRMGRNHRDQRMVIYRAVGEWLHENTPPDSSVGAVEIGAIGYYAQRRMVDFAGLLQPDVAAQMKPDTTYADTAAWAIAAYRPEYIVLPAGAFAALENDLQAKCAAPIRFPAAAYAAAGMVTDMVVYPCPPR